MKKSKKPSRAVDINPGDRFGSLTVIEEAGRDKYSDVLWRCVCDCGNEVTVRSVNLKTGHTVSCGCRKKEAALENVASSRDRWFTDGTHVGLLNNKLTKANKSGIKGVSWNKSVNKWMATIGFKNRKYYLGVYDDIADAAEARREAEEMLFGPVLEKHGRELTSEDEYQEQVRKALEKIREDDESDENQGI